MEAIAQKIREAAKKLLSEGTVDVVIGYAKGSVPMREYPYFAYTPEEAENLTWSSFCCNNLALYTIRRPGRMAVVAQGCVSRNLVNLINENQIKRENLYIIGLNSPGMVDRRKVQAMFPGKAIIEVVEKEPEHLLVKGQGFEERIERKKFLRSNCLTCVQRNSTISDELIGQAAPEGHGGNIDNVAAPWEKLVPGERWAELQETFKDCIRCYACRDACPLCYCHVCFVDEAQPQWCGKSQDEADVVIFHLLRAFHCAGRCTDCGTCESACPQGIKMRRLTSKIEKDIRELYGYRPGMEIGVQPPMSLFKPNDPQDFIK
ncbi:formate dehydrogenase (coenzyme F420) beta subunit [Desulfarculales bacterium]